MTDLIEKKPAKILKESTIHTLAEMDRQKKRTSLNLQRVLDSHEALRDRLKAAEALTSYTNHDLACPAYDDYEACACGYDKKFETWRSRRDGSST